MRLITQTIRVFLAWTILGFCASLLLCSFPLMAQEKTVDYIKNTLYPSVGLLYGQDSQGSMMMRCTATAIEKDADGSITFLTAAHCGCVDNNDKKQVSPDQTINFYITSDDPDDKEFERASVIGCGYRTRGDDFMFLSVRSKKSWPIVKLGKDPELLDPVVNVASPLGLGKQTFIGTVSSPKLDRPVKDKDENINWEGVVALQLFGVNGGSSGSSVICINQQAICAEVVGSIGQTTMTAMPVSRLIAVKNGIADRTYKYWVPDPNAPTK